MRFTKQVKDDTETCWVHGDNLRVPCALIFNVICCDQSEQKTHNLGFAGLNPPFMSGFHVPVVRLTRTTSLAPTSIAKGTHRHTHR
ncbi:unnamed protein product [Choristocarpus tenellus]